METSTLLILSTSFLRLLLLADPTVSHLPTAFALFHSNSNCSFCQMLPLSIVLGRQSSPLGLDTWLTSDATFCLFPYSRRQFFDAALQFNWSCCFMIRLMAQPSDIMCRYRKEGTTMRATDFPHISTLHCIETRLQLVISKKCEYQSFPSQLFAYICICVFASYLCICICVYVSQAAGMLSPVRSANSWVFPGNHSIKSRLHRRPPFLLTYHSNHRTLPSSCT